MTKGYGLTAHDIDWSSPADMEPYAKAYNLQLKRVDLDMHTMGLYVLNAVSVAVEHNLAGRKAKSKYLEKPFLQSMAEEQEENGYSESKEQVAVYEMKQRINLLRKSGLPESPE